MYLAWLSDNVQHLVLIDTAQSKDTMPYCDCMHVFVHVHAHSVAYGSSIAHVHLRTLCTQGNSAIMNYSLPEICLVLHDLMTSLAITGRTSAVCGRVVVLMIMAARNVYYSVRLITDSQLWWNADTSCTKQGADSY